MKIQTGKPGGMYLTPGIRRRHGLATDGGTCLRALMDRDFPAVLARVQCPVLACADADDVYAALFPRIAADRPEAVIATYGPAGIAGPELRPDELAKLLRDFVDASEAR